jgi:hypothetical protein
MRYLFDSDVLISSARFHYHPNYCEAFWAWISAGHKAGLFFSIDKVKGELLDGDKDPLLAWSNLPSLKDFFQPSLPSLPMWRALSAEANNPARNFQMAAKTKFLNAEKADAWLIAHAAHNTDFTIVTNEVSAPNSKREIKLPDASAWLKVPTTTIHPVLQRYAKTNFTFKP